MLIKILGMILRLRRIQKNISIKDLSKMTDISKSELNKIENGKIKAPSSVFLYRLANVLDLDYNYILKYKYASYYRKKEMGYGRYYI